MRRERRPFNHKLLRLLSLILAVACLAFAALSIAAVAFYQRSSSSDDWPHVTTLETERIGQNSLVLAADGSRIGEIAAPENRRPLPLARMGEYLPQAMVAIEDRRFYSHNGVDRKGITRAMWRNIKARGYVEGGSTIDQQLVRNLYPEIDNDRTLTRKMKEASLARELNQLWQKEEGSHKKAKDRILALYLNLVFFGNNAYGVEAASRAYFNIPAAELDMPRAATIAGLVQNPSAYDPRTNPDGALERRNQVLDAMHAAGFISADERDDAKAEPLGLSTAVAVEQTRAASEPYVLDFVRRRAEQAYGKDAVQRGGLRLHTTIDPAMQKHAERVIADTLDEKGDPAAAMVVIENRSGAIRAMASSTRYAATQFNFAAAARRQPGSAAKIWALAALVQGGVDPGQVRYLSTPLAVRPGEGKAVWKPRTYDGSYVGLIDVREATIRSDNSVFAQITLDIGPGRVANTARRLGIDSELEAVESIGLGSQAVTPLELTSFYSTIARGGVRVDPYALREVTSVSGTSSEQRRPKVQRVMHPWQAAEIVSILAENVERGTGGAAQLDGRPSAGKTGTTDEYKDAWFCGMTPTHTACVWVGYPTPRPMTNVHGIRVAGGTLPAEIWGGFMRAALTKVKPGKFADVEPPKNLERYVPGWCNRAGIEIEQGPRSIRCSSTREDGIEPGETD